MTQEEMLKNYGGNTQTMIQENRKHNLNWHKCKTIEYIIKMNERMTHSSKNDKIKISEEM